MTVSVRFDREGDDLVMLLPIVASNGERTALERWGFEEVVRELELLAEQAAAGDRTALKVYQRLVWSLRGRRQERQTEPPPGESTA